MGTWIPLLPRRLSWGPLLSIPHPLPRVSCFSMSCLVSEHFLDVWELFHHRTMPHPTLAGGRPHSTIIRG